MQRDPASKAKQKKKNEKLLGDWGCVAYWFHTVKLLVALNSVFITKKKKKKQAVEMAQQKCHAAKSGYVSWFSQNLGGRN